MEEGSGDVVVDSSGLGHDQHLAGPPAAPTWSTDAPPLTGGNGWSLAFDNAGDLSYAFPITQTVGSSELTVETWVKFEQLGGGELPFISASQQYFAQSWALATYAPRWGTLANHNYSSSGCLIATVGAGLSPGAWTHVAFVYDGNEPINTDRVKVYVNGNRVVALPAYECTIPSALTGAQPAVRLGYVRAAVQRQPGRSPHLSIARSSTDIATTQAGRWRRYSRLPQSPSHLGRSRRSSRLLEDGGGERDVVVDSSGLARPTPGQSTGRAHLVHRRTGAHRWQRWSLAFDNTGDLSYAFPSPRRLAALS